ncbi:MAG: methylenetetrahydrofolate--tRNA-(uracil(54)-C(5))-methyltransferase (FADH(2)-oxidizing) TrmFO, partial [Bosea sp. (in: a-proteobacteria)]
FQPMNVNFGLFPPIPAPKAGPDGKRLRGPEKSVARKRLLTARAKEVMEGWADQHAALWPAPGPRAAAE